MVVVFVHEGRIQSNATVVDFGAEIGIPIVDVHKGRAVVTGKTLAELIC
jgi:hypothetical protein